MWTPRDALPTTPRRGADKYRTHAVILVLAVSVLLAGTAAAQELPGGRGQAASRTSAGAAASSDHRTVTLFPGDDLFRPLLADPKETMLFASLLTGSSTTRGRRTGSVGLGAAVPIVRWRGATTEEGFEVGFSGGVFAQFDLTKPSHDLINADYVVGLPISYRRGDFSARFRMYHQSSHLGDEFVEHRGTERLNLSFESLELLLSRDVGPLRGYGGGEFRFNRTPHDSLEHLVLHGGMEYRHAKPLVRLGGAAGLRPVVAVDAQSFQYRDWSVGWSGRLGVELGSLSESRRGGRSVSFVVEFYEGPNPYGQFFGEEISSVGFGAHFNY